MHCAMLPKIRYLESGRMLLKQKETVYAKIRAFSKSHVVHPPPKEWRNGPRPIDPFSISAIKESGWSPDMDELARQPRHGPNYNQLLHLLNDLQNHSAAWPFLQPVNKDEVPDYYDVIKDPMDLSTMEEKHENDMYPTPQDFIKDAKLIFDNCRRYNSESTSYAKNANKLEKFMWQQIRNIPEWSVSCVIEKIPLPAWISWKCLSEVNAQPYHSISPNDAPDGCCPSVFLSFASILLRMIPPFVASCSQLSTAFSRFFSVIVTFHSPITVISCISWVISW